MWKLCRKQQRPYAQKIESFINQNPQRCLSLRKLTTILELFQKWWAEEMREESKSLGRSVLQYTAKRAFWSDTNDGTYVVKVLDFLHQSGSDFRFFLFPESDFHARLTSFDASPNHPIHFFLNHAYRQKLTIRGRRFADVEVICSCCDRPANPCFMAVLCVTSPFMFRLLLQFGALMTDETVKLRRLTPNIPAAECTMSLIEYATLCMLFDIKIVAHIGDMVNERSKESNAKKFRDLAQCVKVMMRVCPQIKKSSIRHFNEASFVILSDEDLYWIAENGIPELKFRIYCPMPLKHASRLTVRKSLNNNWQLPHGIEKLQIPETLKGYLNICSD